MRVCGQKLIKMWGWTLSGALSNPEEGLLLFFVKVEQGLGVQPQIKSWLVKTSLTTFSALSMVQSEDLIGAWHVSLRWGVMYNPTKGLGVWSQ